MSLPRYSEYCYCPKVYKSISWHWWKFLAWFPAHFVNPFLVLQDSEKSQTVQLESDKLTKKQKSLFWCQHSSFPAPCGRPQLSLSHYSQETLTWRCKCRRWLGKPTICRPSWLGSSRGGKWSGKLTTFFFFLFELEIISSFKHRLIEIEWWF